MSSVTSLPYVAPWQTGFERYSVQFIGPVALTDTHLRWVVPDGQWWRIILLAASLTTDATVGNRTPFLTITPAGSGVAVSFGTPLAVTASKTGLVSWGPTLNALANTSGGTPVFGEAPLPDLLWQPATQIDLFPGGVGGANDIYNLVNTSIGVEVYTEDYRPVFTPAPATIPALL